jgi:cytochrome c
LHIAACPRQLAPSGWRESAVTLFASKEGKMNMMTTKSGGASALGLGLGLVLALAAPAMAQDAAAGEKAFAKCKACHSLTAGDGTAIVKGGKTGPDLFGVIGRPVASVADFKYGDSILAVGASGAVWDEASLAAYVADPAAWLQEKTGDGVAKSKMSFKLAEGGADIAAYLASLK